jgi:hypothetical protein
MKLRLIRSKQKTREKTLAELQQEGVYIKGRQQLKKLFDLGLELPLAIK